MLGTRNNGPSWSKTGRWIALNPRSLDVYDLAAAESNLHVLVLIDLLHAEVDDGERLAECRGHVADRLTQRDVDRGGRRGRCGCGRRDGANRRCLRGLG